MNAKFEFEKAIEIFSIIIKDNNNDAQTHHNLALSYYQNGKFNLAIEHFKKARSLGKKSSDIGLAQCYLLNENFEKGFKVFETRLDQDKYKPLFQRSIKIGENRYKKNISIINKTKGKGDKFWVIQYNFVN